ncbi:MAG: TonB-dependent receptor, partial [Gemmatimonadota bacterium]
MSRSRVRTLFAALLCFVAGPLLAQSGTIRGKISDSAGVVLPNATVVVEGTGLRASSNSRGLYELRGVRAGSFTLRVRLIGFTSQSMRVTLEAGGTVEQDFTMPRPVVQLAAIDVLIGSRARHTAAEELAVPVDIFTSEEMSQQGSTETSQILQSLSPSVNFPRQSVTDGNDIVRPFTLRGLSPDHTLVLLNGWRRHQTALVNNFTYGMGAGSSGVDLNAIPSGAIDRIEVLRDGASAQYGSDAIAGVVNLVTKEGRFTPFVNTEAGEYVTGDYDHDGAMVDINGGWGIGLGRGSLGIFGEFQHRDPTNRAWADPFETAGTGVADSINDQGQVVHKNNPVAQPNHHWGDGLERDVMTLANFRMPLNATSTSEVYAFGAYSSRTGTGNAYRRYDTSARNWQELYPLGFLPEFRPDVTDYSATGGFRMLTGGWSLDFGGTFGHNDFEYNMRNTNNASLGPCLDVPCAPGPDGILGNGDDPGIPNQLSFFSGRVSREEMIGAVNAAKPLRLGLPNPVNFAVGAAFRRESYQIEQGEVASWINGGHLDQDSADVAPAGSSGFPGFAPTDESNSHRNNVGAYIDLETDLNAQWLANVAARYEHYSDFGSAVTGKLAMRFQPTSRLTIRGAASTGFRAPGLSQSHFSKITTNVIAGQFEEIGIFPVDHPAALLLGSKPLKEEKSVNLSAGFAFTPVDNLTITADLFYIKINDRIMLSATFDDDTTLAILTGGGFTGVTGVQYFTNGLDTKTQGLDLTADLRIPSTSGRTLEFIGSVNYTSNTISRIDPLPAVLANSAEPGIIDSVTYIGITEERPDWRATLTSRFESGRFHAMARGAYYGKFSSAQPGFCDLCRDNYGSKTLFDTELGYRFNLIAVSLGVRNLFDTYP